MIPSTKKNIDDMIALREQFRVGDVVLVRGTVTKIMYDAIFIETMSGKMLRLRNEDNLMNEVTRDSVQIKTKRTSSKKNRAGKSCVLPR